MADAGDDHSKDADKDDQRHPGGGFANQILPIDGKDDGDGNDGDDANPDGRAEIVMEQGGCGGDAGTAGQAYRSDKRKLKQVGKNLVIGVEQFVGKVFEIGSLGPAGELHGVIERHPQQPHGDQRQEQGPEPVPDEILHRLIARRGAGAAVGAEPHAGYAEPGRDQRFFDCVLLCFHDQINPPLFD